MITAVYVSIYAGLLIFIVGCVRRILEDSPTPLLLRWEFYPIPHEQPGSPDHGDSPNESPERLRGQREVHERPEPRATFQEIVFLKGMRELDRPLWFPSFLFHSGVYLSLVSFVLAFIASFPGTFNPDLCRRIAAALGPFCRATFYAAATLMVLGTFSLLLRRISDRGVKTYAKAADSFNLLFFIATLVCLAIGVLRRTPDTVPIGEVAIGVLRFDRSLSITPSLGVGLILAAVLIAYIPFTHVSHSIAKHFTQHAVH